MQNEDDLPAINRNSNLLDDNIKATGTVEPNVNDAKSVEIAIDEKDDQKMRKTNYPNYPTGQTPYYQQRVGGQPIYVQGGGPVDAQRTPAYRPGINYGQQNPPPYPDPDEGMHIFRSDFEERSIRNRFIKKVYAILATQLVFTAGFISMCVFTPPIKEFVSRDFIGLIVAAITTMIIYIVLVCVQSTRRQVPLNFILLAIFTLAESYVFSVISSHYSTFIVLTSLGLTAIVCTTMSLLACFVCCDVTGCVMLLCAASVIVMVFGIIAICLTIFLHMKIMFLIYAVLIALLFSMYLIYDTQQIMGGRRIQLSEEEYICGALTLYVDIMQIFWAILTIFGYSYKG